MWCKQDEWIGNSLQLQAEELRAFGSGEAGPLRRTSQKTEGNSSDTVMPKATQGSNSRESNKGSLARQPVQEPSLGLGTALTASALYLERGVVLNS